MRLTRTRVGRIRWTRRSDTCFRAHPRSVWRAPWSARRTWEGPGTRAAPRSDGGPPPKVRDYYRQYAGIILKGRKLILINGFYKSHVEYTIAWLAMPRSEAELAAFPAAARNKDYWHFVPVVVLEGGDHYFEAYYDPAHRRISSFEFHGYV
jgi:hypothetical protein